MKKKTNSTDHQPKPAPAPAQKQKRQKPKPRRQLFGDLQPLADEWIIPKP